MRRILATNICATFRYFVIKLSDDKKIRLCQLVGQEGTKHHKFRKNYCLQHVLKAIHGQKRTEWPQLGRPHWSRVSLRNVCDKIFRIKKKLACHIWATHVKSQTNVTNVIMHPLGQAIWGLILKRTVYKSQTNEANMWLCMHPLSIFGHNKRTSGRRDPSEVQLSNVRQAIWGDIWKRTLGKRQTNATNVTLNSLVQALLKHIWKYTMEKSKTNVTNVTMHLLIWAVWGLILKHTNWETIKNPEFFSCCLFKPVHVITL